MCCVLACMLTQIIIAIKHYDPTETRVLVTQASPGRHGLLTQLAITLRVSLCWNEHYVVYRILIVDTN